MSPPEAMSLHTIAFQGWPGANSDLACRQVFPELTTLPCRSFEDTLNSVHDGRAGVAMIPVENSVAGRVADIHHLLPDSGLYITGEHFQRIHHHLLAVPGATVAGLRRVHSHVHALDQCRALIAELGVERVVHADTAGAAEMVARLADPAEAAISSSLAAEIYGLDSLKADIEDAEHNTTRFLIMEREPRWPSPNNPRPTLTTFVFEVRSVPAALYKAMGGFATNGINMTKLESYMVGGRFSQARFFADVEGHPHEKRMKLAFEELDFFTREGSVQILGVYTANPFRQDPSQVVGAD